MIWNEERQRLANATFDKWHGTPHRDRMAVPGIGIDCINLVTQTLFDAGIVERLPFSGYKLHHGTHEQSQRLQMSIEAALRVKKIGPAEATQFGDIWIFKTGGRSGHCGIIGEQSQLWHALAKNRVTRSDAETWRADLDVAYRLIACGWIDNPQTVVNRIESYQD